jgi:hypothetical protein
MKTEKQIVQYLEELAQVLSTLQVNNPFYMLVTGGAYMILRKKRRFTEDIDFALLEPPPTQEKTLLTLKVLRSEVSRNMVPFAQEFKDAVKIVAGRYPGQLDADWLNDEAAVYYYDDAPIVDATFWRSFGGLLFVYLPTAEYIFATKIAASRDKDEKDITLLIKELQIVRRAQAKAIVNKYLLPEAQEFWEVEERLEELFPN